MRPRRHRAAGQRALHPAQRDWVPADHLAHFVIDAVEELDLRQVRVNSRGTGDEQYPPTMLLSLVVYSYATGTFGSRRIEQTPMTMGPIWKSNRSRAKTGPRGVKPPGGALKDEFEDLI